MTQETKQDGGPAFPHIPTHGSQDGMTLRDWFAGQALSNMGIGAQDVDVAWFQQHGAKHAYAIADAMLEARKQ